MKIEKAIQVLDDYNPEEEYHNYGDIWEDLKLGIEALKAIRNYRNRTHPGLPFRLPGETED